MLPIGLNMCTPGDQELISPAKSRYSYVSHPAALAEQVTQVMAIGASPWGVAPPSPGGGQMSRNHCAQRQHTLVFKAGLRACALLGCLCNFSFFVLVTKILTKLPLADHTSLPLLYIWIVISRNKIPHLSPQRDTDEEVKVHLRNNLHLQGKVRRQEDWVLAQAAILPLSLLLFF